MSKEHVDEESILWRVPQWFPALSQEKLSLLRRYQLEMVRFNRTINLISAKSIVISDLLHFADSIGAAQLIVGRVAGSRVFDIGSGNGFPGVVLGILSPSTSVVLVDSDQRKIEFLKHVVSLLALPNVTALCSKVEALPDSSVSFAISRAFAPLATALAVTRRVFSKGGLYFHLKGEEWGAELTQIPSQVCGFWKPSLFGTYQVPLLESKFHIVLSEKIQD